MSCLEQTDLMRLVRDVDLHHGLSDKMYPAPRSLQLAGVVVP